MRSAALLRYSTKTAITSSTLRLVTALVYDVTQHNTLDATTFTLPTFYARDRVAAGTDYVNKLGQTVLFAGGPGYDDTVATTLQLNSTTEVAFGGRLFTTYNFDKAKVATTSKVGNKVQTGVAELTYKSASPSSVFANQQFLGFYRDNSWTNCLGVPIWDYGTDNARFTATTAGTADLQLTNSQPLKFPTEIYIVGEASTTLISVDEINAKLGTSFTSTGDFLTLDFFGEATAGQEFQLIPYNNLVYMIRAVSNNFGLGTVSGLLIDTFVPATSRSPRARGTSAARCSSSARTIRRRRWSTRSTTSTSRASPARRSSIRRSSFRFPSWTRRRGSSPTSRTSSASSSGRSSIRRSSREPARPRTA
jgi:hypothetical protein